MRLPPLRSFLDARAIWYRVERENLQIVIFSILLFLSVMALGLLSVAAWIVGVAPTGGEAFWWAMRHLTDTGSLENDERTAAEILGTVAAFVGIMLVGAGLNAVMTNLMFDGISRLRSVGDDIRFRNHVLIVGWNSRIHGVVRDLLHADPSSKLVILGDIPKEEADRELEVRVFRPAEGDRTLHGLRTRLLYREGHPLSTEDLRRVGAPHAGCLIFLAPGQQKGLEGDVMTLRAYETIKPMLSPDHRPNTILEIRDISLRFHVFLSAGINPRVDRWVDAKMRRRQECGEPIHLPSPNRAPVSRLTLVHGDEVVARTLVQATVQPLLGRLFDTLLSCTGHDLYLLDPPGTEGPHPWTVNAERWRQVVEQVRALPPEQRLVCLNAWLDGGRILGVYRPSRNADTPEGTLRVEFEAERWGNDFDRWPLVVMGDRRHALQLRHHPQDWSPSPPPPPAPAPPANLNLLILGHNRRLPLIIEQIAEFAHQCDQLQVHVAVVGHDLDVTAVKQELQRRAHELRTWNEAYHRTSLLDEVQVLRQDYARWEVLSPILHERPYDTILLLADEGGTGDARALLGQVMLRSFRGCPSGSWTSLAQTRVVVELTDPRNRPAVDADPGVTDAIVSTDIVSQLIAQIAADPRVEEVYRELLDYGDWEIQLRPLASYALGHAPLWKQAFATAAARGEVAIGYSRHRERERHKHRWLALGPAWEQQLDDADQMIVIVRP